MQKKKTIELNDFVQHMAEVLRSFKQTSKKNRNKENANEIGVRDRRREEMARHYDVNL